MKTERKETEIVTLLMQIGFCALILFGFTRCNGLKVCASLNEIDEVTEQQKLTKEKGK